MMLYTLTRVDIPKKAGLSGQWILGKDGKTGCRTQKNPQGMYPLHIFQWAFVVHL